MVSSLNNIDFVKKRFKFNIKNEKCPNVFLRVLWMWKKKVLSKEIGKAL